MVGPSGNEGESTIIEERQESMVSLFANGIPNLRNARLLKPTFSPIDEKIPGLFPLSPSSLRCSFQRKEWPLNVTFAAWTSRNNDLLSWVEIMRPKYQVVWEKAGIFEAVMSSISSIKRYRDLIVGLAEKWHPETNTFVFPWSETTITLEDVIILGGFSVVGFPVVLRCDTQELKEAEDKLVAEFKKIRGGKRRRIRVKEWRDYFFGSETDIEHEAFLTWWLTRFVFQTPDEDIKIRVFPIACRLARGQIVALGPAVLAGICKDLTLLKKAIVSLTMSKGAASDDCVPRNIKLFSKLELVQLWAWERFPALRPKPNVIQDSDPRSARWNNVEIVTAENVRTVLDSAGKTFDWRPYAKVVNNKQCHIFYREQEELMTIDRSSSKELVSFALCLRPSELIGLAPGCIQQYLPHRVAMQFGYDQDVPSHVARFNESLDNAWKNYLRPFCGSKLYIPSRFFKSDVTVRYFEWWKKVATAAIQQDVTKGIVWRTIQQDLTKGIVRRKRSLRKRSGIVPWVKPKEGENDASVPPGFQPILITVKPEPLVDEVEPEAIESKNGESNTFMEANIISSGHEVRIAKGKRGVAELKSEHKLGENQTKEAKKRKSGHS